MGYFGLGIIIVSIGLTFYCFFTRKSGGHAIFVFVLFIIGATLYVVEKVSGLDIIREEFVTKLEGAAKDADKIKEIKSTAEGIGSALFEDINKARGKLDELTKFLEELDKLSVDSRQKVSDISRMQKEASEELEELSFADSFLLLLAKARSDDAYAFNEMLEISKDFQNPFSEIAKQAVSIIDIESQQLVYKEFPWKEKGINPKKITYKQFKSFYESSAIEYHIDLIKGMWQSKRIRKRKKLELLIDMLALDESIKVRAYVTKLLDEEANIHKGLLDMKQYLEWWEKNEKRYK